MDNGTPLEQLLGGLVGVVGLIVAGLVSVLLVVAQWRMFEKRASPAGPAWFLPVVCEEAFGGSSSPGVVLGVLVASGNYVP